MFCEMLLAATVVALACSFVLNFALAVLVFLELGWRPWRLFERGGVFLLVFFVSFAVMFIFYSMLVQGIDPLEFTLLKFGRGLYG